MQGPIMMWKLPWHSPVWGSPSVLTVGGLSCRRGPMFTRLAVSCALQLDPEDEAEEIRASRPQSGWSFQSLWDGARGQLGWCP